MGRLDELRAEHRRLINSMEFAYAMGARRSLGARDPRLDGVVARVAELEREIAALSARDDADEPT
ncbi:hypothetical protein [Conexibacter woesei]|uniref:Uncharacterized protein n=1 Tax=Conexibacter woesei (strain DSM 14684 / CCUG 47730 / CIP 108061 / JCM 11494 / NBRC 100937 / ID131577) TaxID=469383 RepID=D3FBS3_CONWI|nr:hypothetical protein [Conexibacter woesei]ADB51338.1 hypothetical protein Cwoe_2919 [Conexibacter woesei DSM 14684]